MKRIVILLSLGAVAGGVLLSGCSKSKKAATQSGSNADSSGTAAVASDSPVEMKIKWTAGKKYAMRMELN
jgi:outer membrane murein-binding lipoprotein Lpp